MNKQDKIEDRIKENINSSNLISISFRLKFNFLNI